MLSSWLAPFIQVLHPGLTACCTTSVHTVGHKEDSGYQVYTLVWLALPSCQSRLHLNRSGMVEVGEEVGVACIKNPVKKSCMHIF